MSELGLARGKTNGITERSTVSFTPDDSAGPSGLGLFASPAAFYGSTTRAGPRLYSPEAPAGRGIGKLCVRLDSKAPLIQSCIVFI